MINSNQSNQPDGLQLDHRRYLYYSRWTGIWALFYLNLIIILSLCLDLYTDLPPAMAIGIIVAVAIIHIITAHIWLTWFKDDDDSWFFLKNSKEPKKSAHVEQDPNFLKWAKVRQRKILIPLLIFAPVTLILYHIGKHAFISPVTYITPFIGLALLLIFFVRENLKFYKSKKLSFKK